MLRLGSILKKKKINLNIYPTPCTKVNSLSCGVKAGLRGPPLCIQAGLKLALHPRVALHLPFSYPSLPSASITGVFYHTWLRSSTLFSPVLAKLLQTPESQRLCSSLLTWVDLLCSWKPLQFRNGNGRGSQEILSRNMLLTLPKTPIRISSSVALPCPGGGVALYHWDSSHCYSPGMLTTHESYIKDSELLVYQIYASNSIFDLWEKYSMGKNCHTDIKI